MAWSGWSEISGSNPHEREVVESYTGPKRPSRKCAGSVLWASECPTPRIGTHRPGGSLPCAWRRHRAQSPRRFPLAAWARPDRKSTRLNSSHLGISYAVFCLKKQKTTTETETNSTYPCNSHHSIFLRLPL